MYEFDIEYRHENGNADALSKWLLEEEESETEIYPDPGFVVNKVILQEVEFNENQLEDEAIAALYSWVREGGRPVQCEKIDPELYVYWKDDGIHFQYVVPRGDREAVLKKIHDDPLGGHLGVDKTTDKLKNKQTISNDYMGYVYLLKQSKKKGVSKKLSHKWKGPYTITEVRGENNYLIRPDSGGKKQLVHANRLKKCFRPAVNRRYQSNIKDSEIVPNEKSDI
ncbi:unnamed protein product [Brachionus calyciflorus]|uniref:Integrase zinc-binding domain-containing protein n=1 Tax=Brachionus calyciflorus TaxID=104777 RepID=A0A813S9J3_9BILA|nr:unnamed protein product [Brachionus calyciflorus]